MQQFVCRTQARRQRSCTTGTGILVTVCALCPAPRWRSPQCTLQDMSTRTRERATWRLISARWLMLGEPSRNFNIGKNGFPRALLKHFFCFKNWFHIEQSSYRSRGSLEVTLLCHIIIFEESIIQELHNMVDGAISWHYEILRNTK